MHQMRVKFTRHARRRAKLYSLAEGRLADLVREAQPPAGTQTILRDIPGVPYPVKIVVAVEEGCATVITTYPLKKGRKA